jgi:hypothetical protein
VRIKSNRHEEDSLAKESLGSEPRKENWVEEKVKLLRGRSGEIN